MTASPTGVFPELITTPRVRLRKPQCGEKALYARQANEAYPTREPLTDDRGRAFAAFMVEHWERYAFGFLIVERTDVHADPQPIGHIGFKYIEAWPDHWPESPASIELGFSVIPAARGHGYVTEGARAALAAAFAALDVASITGRCNHANPRSAAVLERCGMTEVEPSAKFRHFIIKRPEAAAAAVGVAEETALASPTTSNAGP